MRVQEVKISAELVLSYIAQHNGRYTAEEIAEAICDFASKIEKVKERAKKFPTIDLQDRYVEQEIETSLRLAKMQNILN